MKNSPNIDNILHASALDVIRASEILVSSECQAFMKAVSELLIRTFQSKKKLIIAGNGGSLCDAMHVAEEFTGYFRARRPALPAIAISDPGHISCVGNDTSFHDVYSRGVEAHGVQGDVFIALTTSGNSENLIRAIDAAKAQGLHTVAFLGKTGGSLKGKADLEFIVQGFKFSDRIQEVHMAALHIIIEAVEKTLFPEYS